mmetsp:Transcript_48659/g.93081  ORF Transcript_48659/g.93081 Transcript_48659/m.93081 type:complete len:445 (+) Transcript_48659:2395-3729(+)
MLEAPRGHRDLEVVGEQLAPRSWPHAERVHVGRHRRRVLEPSKKQSVAPWKTDGGQHGVVPRVVIVHDVLHGNRLRVRVRHGAAVGVRRQRDRRGEPHGLVDGVVVAVLHLHLEGARHARRHALVRGSHVELRRDVGHHRYELGRAGENVVHLEVQHVRARGGGGRKRHVGPRKVAHKLVAARGLRLGVPGAPAGGAGHGVHLLAELAALLENGVLHLLKRRGEVPVYRSVLARARGEGGGVVAGVSVIALVPGHDGVGGLGAPRSVLGKPGAVEGRKDARRRVVALRLQRHGGVAGELRARQQRAHQAGLRHVPAAHGLLAQRLLAHGPARVAVAVHPQPGTLVERKVRRHVLQVLVRRAVHGVLDLVLRARHLPQLHLVQQAPRKVDSHLQRVEVRVVVHRHRIVEVRLGGGIAVEEELEAGAAIHHRHMQPLLLGHHCQPG